MSAFARFRVGSGGGGDIQCDNLIQNLVFQDPTGNLQSWIKNGGPEAGKLDLSSSLNPNTGNPYTYDEYDTAMFALINTFAKSPDVNCVRPGDKGYPVSVDDNSKICATSVDKNGVHMICDRNLFIALTTDQQIEQTHHEFAILAPGLEPDTGPISTYKISTQLSNSIADVSERRLVVKTDAETTVQAPTSGYGTSGTLLIEGNPNSLQRTSSFVYPADKDAYINQPLQLNPGRYSIEYQGVWLNVEIQAGQETVVKMGTLNVNFGQPGKDQIAAYVFLDYTDPSMQDRALQDAFVKNSNAPQPKGWCTKTSRNFTAGDLKACRAQESSNYKDLLNTYMQFNADGSISTWDYNTHSFSKKDRSFVDGNCLTDDYLDAIDFPRDLRGGCPTSVALFSGVYGIIYKDVVTQQTQTQYGIKVE